MRRRLSALLALVLLATVAGPVAAAQPIRSTFTETFIECPEPFVGATGVIFVPLFGSASGEDFEDVFADLVFWAGLSEPEADPTAFSVDATGSTTSTSLSMTVDLVDIDFNPFGIAQIEAALIPDGDPVPFSFRERFGNSWRIAEGTDQALTVSGTVSVEGDVVDLVGCSGVRHTETSFQTMPNANVIHDTFRDLFCEIVVGDSVIFVFGFGGTETASLGISVEPDGLFGGLDVPWVSDGAGGWLASGTFEVVNLEDEPAGTGSIDIHLVPDGDPVLQYLPRRVGWEKSVFQAWTVTGSIAFHDAGIETSDLTGCDAQDEDHRAVFTSQKGPKAPPPPNDTPDGAIALTRGSVVDLRTGGASDGEAPASCLEGPFGTIPFSKTVWYTIEGDGSPMTVDTAGSDYDTVLAVYIEEDLGDGPVLTEVACVDDVPLDPGRTLQAAITGDTDDGVTYWIQVGGFENEWGRLHLTVE